MFDEVVKQGTEYLSIIGTMFTIKMPLVSSWVELATRMLEFNLENASIAAV